MKILNTVGKVFATRAREILDALGQVDYVNLSQEELIKRASEYEIFFVCLGLHFDRRVLERAQKLRVICTATTGLDHIDIAYAKERGIEVLSLRREIEFLNSITSTAELALGLMIDLHRKISFAFEAVKQYQWKNEKYRGYSLSGKTLGIVGLGRLGKMMARYGNALGMNVIACDPYVEDSVFINCKVQRADFQNLVGQSDVISLHVHLSEETKNMFHKDVFQKMKKTSYLVNTSRGYIVQEDDLLEALSQNVIVGYGTDVLTNEIYFQGNFSNHPLVEYAKNHENCIITPHIGGTTYESREATDIFMARKLERYITEHPA